MARGRLEPPNLDDRTWQDLVDQATALIRGYSKEWTDPGPSDPGMTLVELFAWLVEGMIFRLNRVPEKNYITFLNLLGITRLPATPATTWLTYTCNGKAPVTLPEHTAAATQQTDSRPAIVFETDRELTVLPSNLVKLYSKHAGTTDAPSPASAVEQSNLTEQLVNPATPGRRLTGAIVLPIEKVISGSTTWTATFWLGFDARAEGRYSIHLDIAKPAWKGKSTLALSYSKKGQAEVNFVPVNEANVTEGTDGLRRTGEISFWSSSDKSKSPADWEAVKLTDFAPVDKEANTDRHWLKLVFTSSENGLKIESGRKPVLEIKAVLFNSVPATAVQTVNDEVVGLGIGRPFQSFELANRPLYKDPRASQAPYSRLELQVEEKNAPAARPGARTNASTGEWKLVDEISSKPDAREFRLDPVTGTVYFGDGAPGEPGGVPPPEGSRILATYRHVSAGAAGNVPAGAINILRVRNDGISRVVNLVPASDGTDEEDIDETKRRAPRELRNFNRAVTLQDYEDLARKADNRVNKVRCLGPRYLNGDASLLPESFGGMIRQEGSVFVLILPADSSAGDPLADPQPNPSIDLLQQVHRFLDDRRPIATRLFVVGPRYLVVKIKTTVRLWPDALKAGGDDARKLYKSSLTGLIDQAIVKYLHPITGKSDGEGWKVGEHFFVSGLFQHVQQTTIGNLGYIESLTAKGTPGYIPANRPDSLPQLTDAVGVGLADYEIVCSARGPVGQPWHEVEVKEINDQ
jgi:hypothetical protein